jgi:hypothetical protein
MASDLGPKLKPLNLDDEELLMALYFMHHRLLGDKSPIYYSIVTATPPDLPLGWSDEEIDYL